MMKQALPFSLCLSLLAISQSTSEAEDWYRWRGPRLDGVSQESEWSCAWDQGARIAWRANVGVGYSSIVTAGGRAFTLGHVDGHDVVSAIDVTDGSMVWQFRYAAELGDRDFEGGPTSTPTVDDQRIYIFSRAGELFCLDVATGKQLWQTSISETADVRLPGWGCSGAPLVIGQRVILNIGESGVAVDKSTGQIVWQSEDRESGYATPMPIPKSDPPAVLIASGKFYAAVEVATGERLWTQRWLTSFNCNAADPIFHGGQVFLSSGYNRGSGMFQLTSESPELVWKSKEMKNQIHSSVLHDGMLYGIDGDMEAGARLRCMDWESGEIRWSEDMLRPGGLALVAGRLILLTETGKLIVAPATPEGWQPIAEADVIEGKCWTAPIFSNGCIYCRSIQGELVCVDCRS